MTDSGEEYVGMDSQEDEESDEEDFELGNVVSAEPSAVLPSFEPLGRLEHVEHQAPSSLAVPGIAHGPQPPAIPTSWPIASKGRQRQDGGLPLILFDLNGVLMQHRFNGTSHQHDLRPGVHHLLRLLPHFRLGVYTSSTRGTVQRALTKLAGNLHNALQQAQRRQHAQQQQQHQYPQALPSPLFHAVLCREHCVPADKALIEARGGKPWDTVKPLQRYFADLSRVLLVDDSPHKSLPAEAANMLVMPRWLGPAAVEGKADSVLPALVDALLSHVQAGLSDVRAATAAITARLAALVGAALPAVPAGLPPSILGSPACAAATAASQQQQLAQRGGQYFWEVGAAAAPPAAASLDAQAGRGLPQQQQQQHGEQQKLGGCADEATAGGCQGGMTRKEKRKRKAGQEGGAEGAPSGGSPRQPPPRPPPRLDSASNPELLAAMRLLYLDALKAETEGWGCRVHDLVVFAEALHPGLAGALWPRSPKPLLEAAVAQGSIQVSSDTRLGRKGPWYSLKPGAEVPSAARMEAIQQVVKRLPASQQAAAKGQSKKQRRQQAQRRQEEVQAGAGSGDGVQVVPQQAEQAQQGSGIAVQAQQQQQQQQGRPLETAQQEEPPLAPSDEEAGAAMQDVLLHSLARFQERGGGDPEALRQHLFKSLREAAGLGRKQAVAQSLRELIGRAEGACIKAKELVKLKVVGTKAAPEQLTWSALGSNVQLPTPGQVEAARDLILTALTAGAAAAGSTQPAGNRAAAVVPPAGLQQGQQQQQEQVHAQPGAAAAATVATAVAAAAAACTAARATAAAAEAAALDIRRPAVQGMPHSAADPAAVAAVGSVAVAAVAGQLEASGLPLLTVFEDRVPSRPAAAAHASGQPSGQQQLAANAPAAATQPAGVPALIPPSAGSEQAALPAAGAAAAAIAAAAAAASVPRQQQPGETMQVPQQQQLQVSNSAAAVPDGQEAAEGQQQQQGRPSKGKLARKERKLLALQELAASLGLPGPGPSHDTKAKLAILRRKLEAEQQRRQAKQEPALRAAFTMEVQQAKLTVGARHAQQAAAQSVEAQVTAHGGHFLRSCGPVEGLGPQHAGQHAQHTGQQLQRQHPGDRGGEQQGQCAAQQPAEQPARQGGQVLLQAQAAAVVRGEAGGAPAQQAKQARLSPHGPSALSVTLAAAGQRGLVEPAVPEALTSLQAPQQAQLAQQAQQAAFSSLHYEVLRFAQRASPTPQEVADVQRAVEGVAAAASELWPQARTVLFGSQATGLALPGSDLDIVILNVGPHLQRAGSGFSQAQRKQLGELLEDLLDGLLGAGLIRGRAQIIEARVPIIKCCLAVGPGLMADVSLGATNGAAAVDFVRRQVVAVPPLRPLCLIVKAFLREHGLNEVFTGGLSSYSVTNMVLAHLQREGFQPLLSSPTGAPATPGGSLAETFAFLQRLAGTAPAAQQAQQAQWDLGVLLWGFFDLFGRRFGYAREAVSIRLGGVCTKIRTWRQARRPWLLAVEDPQEPGKDIASGSFGVQEIKTLFSTAAELLAEVCEDAAANDEVAPAGAAAAQQAQQAQQHEGAGAGVLGGVVNIEAAVGRGLEGVKARRAMEQRSAAKSAAVKQQRARQGIVVGGSSSRTLKIALGNGAGGTGKPPHTSRPKQQQQQQQAAAQGGGGKKGSKRGRLVEAQWGRKDGNFKGDDSDFEDARWSLRKQRKSAKRKGSAAKHGQQQGGHATPGSGKRKGEERKGKGGWVTDSGGGAPGTGRHGKRQKRQQQ